MPRPTRYVPGGMVFHVLNRGAGRRNLFDKPADFLAFERILEESLRVCSMRVCAYCLMSNHWHFVLWPESDGDLPTFMQRLTNTHVKRWQQHRHQTGYGPLYQGRYKAFPVQTDDYFYQVVRYAERNALRANLVTRAQTWPWSSLALPGRGDAPQGILADWPLPRPTNWLELVNSPQTAAELAALRRCVSRGSPFGDEQWTAATAEQLGIASSLRQRGRPRQRNEG